MNDVEKINQPPTSLIWFRNDLRVNDQTSLYKALTSEQRIIAIYCFDPAHFQNSKFGFKKTGKYRARFLIESLRTLKDNLAKLNISLFVYSEAAKHVIPSVIEEFNVKSIFLQEEWTSEEQQETEFLSTIADLNIVTSYDQFLVHPNDAPFDIQNLPDVFTQFRKKVEKKLLVRPELSVPKLKKHNRVPKGTNIPTLTDLGFEEFETDPRTAFPFGGGEEAALEHLNRYMWETHQIETYKETRNGLIGVDYSSKLSAWLANGSISARTVYREVKDYERKVKKNQSTYWLIFELLWRDYFKYLSLKYKNEIFKIKGIKDREYDWSHDEDRIDNWINGSTDEPFVNANMIELKETGWMSNRGRQNVASYFAKELNLDWRIGASYFESLLIDYDVHSNYGNWMYVAGVGNDPRDRKFNIQLQAQRYDPENEFVNRWLKN